MKNKETLEDFAERLCPNKQVEYDMILEGAKWQQERMYSEDDLEKAYKDGGRNEYDFINKYHCKARISFDKWFENFKNK